MLDIIGVRCSKTPAELIAHFDSLGIEAVLFNPNYVCGKDHLLSAYMHAERACSRGVNRSRNLLSEIILYASADRQIGRAIKKMSPKEGDAEFVALLIGDTDDLKLNSIGCKRDDSLIDCTEVSAKNMGLEKSSVPFTELILEHVAAVDIMKL